MLRRTLLGLLGWLVVGRSKVAMPYPESAHPYTPNLDDTQTYTMPGSPASIFVAFDALCETESGYDFIYLFDGANNPVGNPAGYSGTDIAGWTFLVPGDTIKVRLTSDGSVEYWGYRVTVVAVPAWIERFPAGAFPAGEYGNWSCAASNADGSTLVVAQGINIGTGRLYVSSNGGADWVERRPAGDVPADWTSVGVDASGSYIFALAYRFGATMGRIYTSSDGGATWVESQPKGDVAEYWACGAMSSDGEHLIVGHFDRGDGAYSNLYTSADGGANWTARTPAGAIQKDWGGVALNSDGSKMIAGVGRLGGAAGRLYTSVDGGANWTERRPAGDTDQQWACEMSSDGSLLIARVAAAMWTSLDGGASWTSWAWPGDPVISSVAVSAEGSKLIAGTHTVDPTPNFGELWTSVNGGVNWTEETLAVGPRVNWAGVASDADGSNLIAVSDAYEAPIYGQVWIRAAISILVGCRYHGF